MKKEQQIPVSEHFLEGANILVKEFKTPAKFLDFLTEALSWVQEEGVASNIVSDKTFFIRVVVKEVLQQWMIPGDVNKNVASGLKEVFSAVGDDGYNDDVALIIQGFGLSMKNGIYPEGATDDYLLAINTMLKIGRCLSNYGREEREKDLKAA